LSSGEYRRCVGFDVTCPFIALILIPRLRASADPRAVQVRSRVGGRVIHTDSAGYRITCAVDAIELEHREAAAAQPKPIIEPYAD